MKVRRIEHQQHQRFVGWSLTPSQVSPVYGLVDTLLSKDTNPTAIIQKKATINGKVYDDVTVHQYPVRIH
eukprot:scaffold163801_cov21-Cyclotella_meneghiniana.AAC.1